MHTHTRIVRTCLFICMRVCARMGKTYATIYSVTQTQSYIYSVSENENNEHKMHSIHFFTPKYTEL